MCQVVFSKWRVSWKHGNEGRESEAFFWMRNEEDPKYNVSALLNLVELDASEWLYEYKIELVETKLCRLVNE